MPVTFEVEGKQVGEVCMSTDSDFRGLGFFSALIGEFRISTCFFNFFFLQMLKSRLDANQLKC